MAFQDWLFTRTQVQAVGSLAPHSGDWRDFSENAEGHAIGRKAASSSRLTET
jgi:hypothetical protein